MCHFDYIMAKYDHMETKMKNPVFQGLFIAAIFCTVAFSTCKQESDPQKKIIVTGIPAAYNGRFAVILLIYTDYPVAENANRTPVVINNGTVNISLIDVTADGFPPFTESDIFQINFNITDSANEANYYSGVIFSKSITEETTTIRFSEFMDASPKR